jgi:hypothetical protein
MLVPENEWLYAPHLAFEARTVLAPVRSFSDRIHAAAYSIPSIATDLGGSVGYFSDPSLEVIGMCTRKGDGLSIVLNDAIENTEYDMAGLVHELGHAAISEVSFRCTGVLHRRNERDAWLRGIYVAVSRPLADMVLGGHATIRDIASRCSVPTPIVRIRLALAVALSEHDGDAEEAHETIRYELLALEQFFEDGRTHGFREPLSA